MFDKIKSIISDYILGAKEITPYQIALSYLTIAVISLIVFNLFYDQILDIIL